MTCCDEVWSFLDCRKSQFNHDLERNIRMCNLIDSARNKDVFLGAAESQCT
jgi:hypothetical protein